ncbi:MAG: AAA family ATPase, partial [Clostridium sp.]
MIKKSLPVGIDDFKEIIESNYYFVDKSLLINELLSKKSKVTLLSRPRRFGKTLNMSMLNYFFNIDDKD